MNRPSGPQGLNLTEPPGADPHAGWCGRGEWVTTPPMPIFGQVARDFWGSGFRPPWALKGREISPRHPRHSLGEPLHTDGGFLMKVPLGVKTAIRVQRLPKRMPWMARADFAALQGPGWTEAGTPKVSCNLPEKRKGLG